MAASRLDGSPTKCRRQMTNTRPLIALAAFLIACYAVAAIGGAVTATSLGSWYEGLIRPSFAPPNWLFGPVWTVLYGMMAVAAWRVWRQTQQGGRTVPLRLFGIQLALNLGWSLIFFGSQAIALAFVEILLLLTVLVATTLAFRRIDRVAGALFVPYVLWVAFATLLNGGFMILN